MNKPEAKRLACRIAATWIRRRKRDVKTIDIGADDAKRLRLALDALIEELDRRGKPPPDKQEEP